MTTSSTITVTTTAAVQVARVSRAVAIDPDADHIATRDGARIIACDPGTLAVLDHAHPGAVEQVSGFASGGVAEHEIRGLAHREAAILARDAAAILLRTLTDYRPEQTVTPTAATVAEPDYDSDRCRVRYTATYLLDE